MNKVSRIFAPALGTPKNAVVKHSEALSRSQKLMLELGLVKSSSNGTFQIMPLGQKSIDKCIDLINRQMQSVGGQKISLPLLTSARLWKQSGRLDGDITEFFMIRDRHDKDFLLSPTHEEAITAMFANMAPVSYRQLPLRLYQVGLKFRDELKPRFGLLRAKEFLMKDLYTFDCDMKSACDSYERVNSAYDRFFRQLEVPFAKVEACTGIMGGSLSHEYHYMAATGEDRILRCGKCHYAVNIELGRQKNCPNCADPVSLEEVHGIEVGHTFLLGDKYSRALKATYLQENGKPNYFIMGSYGIGLTRLVAAALEVLSVDNELRWPTLLAPFDVCVIGPKQGSKEQIPAEAIESSIMTSLETICGIDEIIQDDRKQLTIGKRLMDAKRMGYPIIIIVGSKAIGDNAIVELHMKGTMLQLSIADTLHEVQKYAIKKAQLFT